MGTTPVASLTKALRLLGAVVADAGRSSLTQIAEGLQLPLPTAHRLALTLEAEGFLERCRKGYYHAGPAFGMVGLGISASARAAWRLRAPLARAAAKHNAYAHFGILEDLMVTYLVKEGGSEPQLFTAEKGQLEAYCSALGKVLLSALPPAELEAYLATGPFVALTARTLTDPERLQGEVGNVGRLGFALDQYEIREDLFCVAVPVRDQDNEHMIGAISLSLLGQFPQEAHVNRLLRDLKKIASAASVKLNATVGEAASLVD